MNEAVLTAGYRPGLIGRVVALHAEYYHAHWDFGLYFEAKVACELADFLRTYRAAVDGIWSAGDGGDTVGAIAIDGGEAATCGAHLRWFITADKARGQGLGHALLKRAIEFCRERHFPSVYLWTFAGLDAAQHLYRQHGFVQVEEHAGDTWGRAVREQKYVLTL